MKSDADICREKGWAVGDVLAGDEGFGETKIRITAIGEQAVLARKIAYDGRPLNCSEASWSLAYRDWQKV